MTALELLDRIETQWRAETHRYRDYLLSLGRQLHEFVLLWLSEADNLNTYQRIKKKRSEEEHAVKRTRENAVKLTATRLGITQGDVTRYIGGAMAVDLLSLDGKVGRMGWLALCMFHRFLERRCDHSNRDKLPTVNESVPGTRGIPVSMAETWQVREQYAEPARKLFREAVEKGLTYSEVRPLVLKLLPKGRSGRGHFRTKEEASALETLGLSFRLASVGDAAEVLFGLLQKTEEPRAVLKKLNDLIAALPRPRPKLAV